MWLHREKRMEWKYVIKMILIEIKILLINLMRFQIKDLKIR